MDLSYLVLNTTDPAYNLAAEQYVFDSLPKEKTYFMLWQNDNAIIIGKHQNTYAEINAEFVKEKNIKVVRRLSGGGAVYHDLGNLNFTFISDATSNEIDFPTFCRPIAKALEKLGVPVEINGRNDMLIDGRKFSGNSQYVRNGRVMHHGTILYDSNLSIIGQSLQVDPQKIESKGIKSVRSRVTNVSEYMAQKVSMPEFIDALLSALLKETPGTKYSLTGDDHMEIDRIRRERYDTWEWNYGYSPECTMCKKARIEGCGSIQIHLSVKHGTVESMEIYGDFFSVNDPSELVRHLVGTPLTATACAEALKNIDVSYYIRGLSNQQFIEILCQ